MVKGGLENRGVKSRPLPEKAQPRALVPIEEREIIRRLKEGDGVVFGIVVERLHEKVYRFALHITGNESDAMDITQETFLTLLKKIEDFRGDSSLASWVFKIAMNYALSKLRERARTLIPPNAADFRRFVEPVTPYHFLSEPERVVERLELRGAILSALGRLDVKYRAILLLSDVEGLSMKDISRILNLKISTVKTRLHRARLYLRKEISWYRGTRGTRRE